MGAFSRDERRFICTGICLNAPRDLCPPGKWPFLQNVRSYQAGTLQSRFGLILLANSALGAGAIHTISRLNDPTPGASAPFFRVFGAGASLFAGQSTYANIDTGYSGNPLTLNAAAPVQSPNPWMYVADSSRMRKFNTDATVATLGIDPPLLAPAAVLGRLEPQIIDFSGTLLTWQNSGAAASALGTVGRVATTIASILYDVGTTGNCSVVPTSMVGISPGLLLGFNGTEAEPVQQICLAVVDTTIAAILYDTGTSGLCTIQPAASLGTGQIEGPSLNDYVARAGFAVPRGHGNVEGTPLASPSDPRATLRQIDFPVNCIVRLGGSENVRILSVALGPDGIQSFRCSTAGTFAAGGSIAGLASFRAFTLGTFAAGNTLGDTAQSNTITPVVTTAPASAATAGIKTNGAWGAPSLALIQGRATLPEDDIHLAIRFDDCTVVTSVRIYFDVDRDTVTGNEATAYVQNYYFFEWRSNDILSAIQGSNTAAVGTLQDARSTVVGRDAVNAPPVATGGGTGSLAGAPHSHSAPAQTPSTSGPGTSAGAVSSQVSLGNSQWIELRCKVKDLIRVGTDTARSLDNPQAAQILVSIFNPLAATPVVVDYDALWLSGGYAPDTGPLGLPYTWQYRYRSSVTGERSNPSPPTRGGLAPTRQKITLQGVQSSNNIVDLVDWFRLGGAIDRYTFVGTTPNDNPPVFVDQYGDQNIIGGPVVENDAFRLWAVSDKSKSGTASLAGSAIRRTGGDNFNTGYAPGSTIIINGQVYTLYASPATNADLQINENAGSGNGLSWTMPEPVLQAQNLYARWGPDLNNVFFACGDVINPGMLYWTFPNDPDRTSDANVVQVTSGSERLQNGLMYDDRPFVFSTDQLYAIVWDATNNTYRGIITPCDEGLWTPWFFCIGPDGIYFGNKSGIFKTAGGAGAVSITDKDLYPLFPHDSLVGVAVNGIQPPDFSQSTRLRLSFGNGWIYFDYVDVLGAGRSLAYRLADQSWWPDVSAPAITTRTNEVGSLVYENLLGGANGSVYSPGGILDVAAAILSRAQFVANQGDARMQKLYRDFNIEGDLSGAQLAVTLALSNGAVGLGTTNLTGGAGRLPYYVNVLPRTGAFGTNIQVDLAWSPINAATPAPLLFFTDIAYQPEVELASSWLSGPTTFNLPGYLHIPGAYICYLSSAAITISLIIDNVVYTYTLPSSGGVYAKTYLWFAAVKGLAFQLGVQSDAPFLLFDKDIEFLVQPWGAGGGYQHVRPF